MKTGMLVKDNGYMKTREGIGILIRIDALEWGLVWWLDDRSQETIKLSDLERVIHESR